MDLPEQMTHELLDLSGFQANPEPGLAINE